MGLPPQPLLHGRVTTSGASNNSRARISLLEDTDLTGLRWNLNIGIFFSFLA